MTEGVSLCAWRPFDTAKGMLGGRKYVELVLSSISDGGIQAECFVLGPRAGRKVLNQQSISRIMRITTNYVETFSSLSTQFLTVGRFIMRSRQAV